MLKPKDKTKTVKNVIYVNTQDELDIVNNVDNDITDEESDLVLNYNFDK
jgi:hypothetical protein